MTLGHRVEPWRVDVARLRVGLVGGLLRLELATLLGERSSSESSSVESSIGRLDDLDGRELERALRLTLQEGSLGVVDLDIELLVAGVGIVGAERGVRVGHEVLVESRVVRGGGGSRGDHLLNLPALGRSHASCRGLLVVVGELLPERDAVGARSGSFGDSARLLGNLLLGLDAEVRCEVGTGALVCVLHRERETTSGGRHDLDEDRLAASEDLGRVADATAADGTDVDHSCFFQEGQ